jgi:hypothetical protein
MTNGRESVYAPPEIMALNSKTWSSASILLSIGGNFSTNLLLKENVHPKKYGGDFI